MRKVIRKKLKQHALNTFKTKWGCSMKEYYNDLKKHYKLTGQVGFCLDVI